MRSVSAVTALAVTLVVALVSCSTKAPVADDHSTTPAGSTTSSSSTAPVKVSVASAPGWEKVTECPDVAAVSEALGATYRDGTTDGDLSPAGTGCQYLTGDGGEVAALDVMVLPDNLSRLQGIWESPPPSIVQEAPQLGADAVIVYTPGDKTIKQCLVATPVNAGTLVVQNTTAAGIGVEDLCAPLGPTLQVLAAAASRTTS